MRRSIHTLCSLLLVASYLWGGCVSCEQFFTLPMSEDCCHEGKCDRAAHDSMQEQDVPDEALRSCEKVVWLYESVSNQVNPGTTIFLPISILPASNLWLSSGENEDGWNDSFDLAAHSPPDLPIRHASLLI